MAYTDAMVAKLHAAAPLDLAKAQALGGELGVSYRSVISKAKQLGIEYVAKAPAARQAKDTGPTKADILAELRPALTRTVMAICQRQSWPTFWGCCCKRPLTWETP